MKATVVFRSGRIVEGRDDGEMTTDQWLNAISDDNPHQWMTVHQDGGGFVTFQVGAVESITFVAVEV